MNVDDRRVARLRLQPASDFEHLLQLAARVALVIIGTIAVAVALDHGQLLFAPVVMAVVIGLMFGPLADRIESVGIPSGVSALAIVVCFLALITSAVTTMAVPLSDWGRYLPQIWTRLRAELANLKDVLATFDSVRAGMQDALGGGEGGLKVAVDNGFKIEDAAWLAPTFLMQVVIFLASLYFFVATRKQIRATVLSLCIDRRLRWRLARVFRDVEVLVSRYLLSITAVNIGLGAAVAIALWLQGVPSPVLWGVMAGVLNYAVFVGPAAMAIILLGVGLATGHGYLGYLGPVLTYLTLNLIEAQVVTPHVIGRTMTLNPFLVFLALVFWIWIWGPVGGFVAVPLMLMGAAIIRHVLPLGGGGLLGTIKPVSPRQP